MQTAGFGFLGSRRFLPLFGTQFMGAFNDNLLRTAVVVLISYGGLRLGAMPADQLVNLAAGLFILPFFLFSATAGKLCECVDKARIARWVKQVEILIMLLAGFGLWRASTPMLLGALFMMGMHSTFFGPLKYSVLPQYMQRQELLGANGLIEMGTFLAILLGQIVGSMMMRQGAATALSLLLSAALCGYGCSRAMPPAPPTATGLKFSLNIARDSWQLLRQAWSHPGVSPAILGISWFWLMGTIYTTQLPNFTRVHLGGDTAVYTLLLALFSIFIGLGSLACAQLSKGTLQLGLVLLGSLGMSVSGVDLALGALARHQGALASLGAFLAHGAHWRPLLDISLLGFFGGCYTVPLYTWLQTASPPGFRSQAIACNNIVNGCYMVAATLLSALLLKQFDSVALLFLLTALANLCATVLLIRRAPLLWRSRFDWLRP
jgi:MFS family permease